MWLKTTLLLGSLALVFALAEIGLRYLAPQKTYTEMHRRASPIYIPDDILIKQLRPGFETNSSAQPIDGIRSGTGINSQGYRGKELVSNPEDHTRIWIVGDSFTFGVGVGNEFTYPAVLEKLLRDPAGKPVEVINAGVSGRWVDEYYLDLKHRGIALKPDIVLVGIYIRNDLDGPDARDHSWPRVDDQGLPLAIHSKTIRIEDGYEVRAIRKSRWKLPLFRDSHVAQLLYDGGKIIDQQIRGRSVKNAHLYENSYAPEAADAIARVHLLLRGMRRLAEDNGAQFVVLLFPGRDQVYPGAYDALSDLDLEKPQRELRAFLDREEIDYLDLLPALRATSETPNLFFVDDDHWDVAGHGVVAGSNRHPPPRPFAGPSASSQLISAPPVWPLPEKRIPSLVGYHPLVRGISPSTRSARYRPCPTPALISISRATWLTCNSSARNRSTA